MPEQSSARVTSFSKKNMISFTSASPLTFAPTQYPPDIAQKENGFIIQAMTAKRCMPVSTISLFYLASKSFV